ncbi:GD22202 [Drosophila simulans]|uniref:GD22202 n=1 Tax=Drosophila simulans TaxID=7240 RepID=B4QA92_DROSI|nr:GD22202 [Drosophila simulans]
MKMLLQRSFRDQSIDGTGLPLLTEDHLVNSLGMKLGPALKLRSILAKKLGGPCPCVACVAQAQQMLALQTGGAAATGATAGAGAGAGAGTESGTTSCSIKSEIFNGGSNGSSSGSSSNQGSDVAAPPAAAASSPSSNMLLPVLPCSGLQDAS